MILVRTYGAASGGDPSAGLSVACGGASAVAACGCSPSKAQALQRSGTSRLGFFSVGSP